MPIVDYQRVIGRAAWVRTRAGLHDADPPYSTNQIMSTVFPAIRVEQADLPAGMIEMAERRGRRATLYYSSKVPHTTQRVGIIHGLHHLLVDMKVEGGIAECNVNAKQLERVGALSQDPVELACDLFAAEVLVPLHRLDEYAPDALFPRDPRDKPVFEQECNRLASRFNVPLGFMRWRLFDLAQMRRSNFALR